MTIPSYRLPPHIERGARGGPDFKTIIQESIGGNEQRIRQWQRARARFDIAYGIRTSADPLSDYLAVLHLFYAHLGKLHPFRFKAWNDYTATDEVFGEGESAGTTSFQLTKTYDPSQILLATPGPLTYVRDITLIVGTPTIMIDGAPTTDYSLSASGVVTFNVAPDISEVLTWTGEFDLPMRFDTDYLPVIMNESDIVQISTIPIREVIGE